MILFHLIETLLLFCHRMSFSKHIHTPNMSAKGRQMVRQMVNPRSAATKSKFQRCICCNSLSPCLMPCQKNLIPPVSFVSKITLWGFVFLFTKCIDIVSGEPPSAEQIVEFYRKQNKMGVPDMRKHMKTMVAELFFDQKYSPYHKCKSQYHVHSNHSLDLLPHHINQQSYDMI